MRRERILSKILNAQITGYDFINKDIDDYLYASLSGPPLKIIDKHGSEDEMLFTVECPQCHSHVNYGKEIYMISGMNYCNNCREEVIRHVNTTSAKND